MIGLIVGLSMIIWAIIILCQLSEIKNNTKIIAQNTKELKKD